MNSSRKQCKNGSKLCLCRTTQHVIVRVAIYKGCITKNAWFTFVAAMVIGFTQRIRTVSEGQEGAVDLFQLQIIVSSLRSAERVHPMLFRILETSTNATVETLTSASNIFDAAFGLRDNLNDPIEESMDLFPGERTISPLLRTAIINDIIPEETECFTIGIFPVDIPGRREWFTCNEDSEGADSYFCEHTICIEDDDGKSIFYFYVKYFNGMKQNHLRWH